MANVCPGPSVQTTDTLFEWTSGRPIPPRLTSWCDLHFLYVEYKVVSRSTGELVWEDTPPLGDRKIKVDSWSHFTKLDLLRNVMVRKSLVGAWNAGIKQY
jgi:hypothetical protein